MSPRHGSPGNQEEIAAQQQAVLEHCHGKVFRYSRETGPGANSALGNRFALLDSTAGAELKGAVDQWSELHGINGALYYPWVRVASFRTLGDVDSEKKQSTTVEHNLRIAVPPCGHVAGVFSRTDRLFGFHKPPANEVIEGILELDEQDRVNVAQQAELDPYGVVNCLRTFPGRGIRVWGARTTSGLPEWRYINVRRVFLTLARWIDQNMSDVAFESNDAKLWSRVRRAARARHTSKRLVREGCVERTNALGRLFRKMR